MEKHQCSAKVSDSSGWHGFPCGINATILYDGKYYCKIHSPEYVKAKRGKANAKWEIEHSKRIAEIIAGKACKQINPDNPRAVAESIADMYGALRGLLDNYSTNPIDDEFFMACLKARKAIAKAEAKIIVR